MVGTLLILDGECILKMIEAIMIMLICIIPLGLVCHKVLMATQNKIFLAIIISQEDLLHPSKHKE